jgi:hypothetical protein
MFESETAKSGRHVAGRSAGWRAFESACGMRAFESACGIQAFESACGMARSWAKGRWAGGEGRLGPVLDAAGASLSGGAPRLFKCSNSKDSNRRGARRPSASGRRAWRTTPIQMFEFEGGFGAESASERPVCSGRSESKGGCTP